MNGINSCEKKSKLPNGCSIKQRLRYQPPIPSSVANWFGIRRAAAASPESNDSVDCSTECRCSLWIRLVRPAVGAVCYDPSWRSESFRLVAQHRLAGKTPRKSLWPTTGRMVIPPNKYFSPMSFQSIISATVSAWMSHGLAEMLRSDPVMATASSSSRCSFSCQEKWSFSTSWANFSRLGKKLAKSVANMQCLMFLKT